MSPKRLPCSVLDRLKQNKIKHWEWYMPLASLLPLPEVVSTVLSKQLRIAS